MTQPELERHLRLCAAETVRNKKATYSSSVNTARLRQCQPKASSPGQRRDTGARGGRGLPASGTEVRPTAQGQPDVGTRPHGWHVNAHAASFDSPQCVTEQHTGPAPTGSPLPAFLRRPFPLPPETYAARAGAPRLPQADSYGSLEPSAAWYRRGGSGGDHALQTKGFKAPLDTETLPAQSDF